MSIFSKLFKKKTNTNFNLINLNDIIIFPKKEFYKENKEKYKEYMDTYNLILSSKKYITSLDLEINNIDINFYTNIITKTTLELDNMLDLVNNNIERSEELATILISKLKYYHNELNTYKNILFIAIPFLLMDLFTRGLGHKINFFGIYRLVPNLFTIIWITLFLGISLSFKKKIGKTLYIIFFILSFALFIVNNVYYSMTDTFFDFSLILLASEGSSYFMDAIINCNIWVYVLSVIVLGTFIYVLKFFPKQNKNNYKRLILVILVFTIMHILTPLLLGKKDVELTWSTWRNPRNIYINFNDNNKSMRISGFYEYNIRNFYITFLKPKKTNSEEELKFLHDMYNMEEEKDNDKYTGLFKGKNLILLQLEGVDTWMLTKETTPTLYNMMMNGINFTNHYSYYNGGGSTFNSEFAVNTGFITPLSFTQNAYSFSKSTFPYTLARLFKNEGYAVNAFHMNTSEFYSRGANYKNWGYDNYYGLIDLYDYKNKEYELDRELILNEDFSNKMFENDKFVDYIITYSSHLPFSTEKGVCKTLITMDALEELGEEKLPKDYTLPVLTEEECAKRQAKETDYMVELLLNKLEEKSLLENTVIVVYTDHYLYTLSDQTILDKYKDTKNELSTYSYFVELATKIPAFPLNIKNSDEIKSVSEFLKEQLDGKDVNTEHLDFLAFSDLDINEVSVESILAKYDEITTK
mgnify:CR=1 FL=1